MIYILYREHYVIDLGLIDELNIGNGRTDFKILINYSTVSRVSSIQPLLFKVHVH